MTKLEDQVRAWEGIKKLIEDSKRLKFSVMIKFLNEEVYPRVRDYNETYGVKYNHLQRPQ